MTVKEQVKLLKSLLDSDKNKSGDITLTSLLPALDVKSRALKRELRNLNSHNLEYVEGGINRLLEGLEGGISDLGI